MQTPGGYHLVREVKVVADGKQYPMSADLGGESFTIREVPLPADYVVTPKDVPQVRAVIDDFRAASRDQPTKLGALPHTQKRSLLPVNALTTPTTWIDWGTA